jgi:RNA polymerase sigma factor (sigma-70 family)
MSTDSELLLQYARDRAESGFAELVRRHVDLVYSAARRRVGGDPHLAAEVTQEVFLSIAHRAESLARHPVLNAWLHASTRNAAANILRRERRREFHRQQVQIMEERNSTERVSAQWDDVSAVLDDALDRLNEGDRRAIVLRFFENLSYAEVGSVVGLREEAARMRVTRALEKLRAQLQRRGVASTAAALGGILSTQAVTAAPTGLAIGIVARVTTAVSATTASTAGLIHIMTTTKFTAVIGGTLAILGMVGVTRDVRATREAEAATAAANLLSETAADQVHKLQRAVADATQSSLAGRTVATSSGSANASARPVITPAPLPQTRPEDPLEAGRKLEAMHPEIRRAQIDWAKAGIRTSFQPLFSALKLSSDQIDRFLEIALNTVEPAGEDLHGIEPYTFSTADNPLTAAESEAQLRALLGPQGLVQYLEFSRSSDARRFANLVSRAAFAGGEPMTAEQGARVAQIIANASASFNSGGDVNIRRVDWQQVEQQAQSILSERQRAALSGAIQQTQFNTLWARAIRTTQTAPITQATNH